MDTVTLLVSGPLGAGWLPLTLALVLALALATSLAPTPALGTAEHGEEALLVAEADTGYDAVEAVTGNSLGRGKEVLEADAPTPPPLLLPLPLPSHTPYAL